MKIQDTLHYECITKAIDYIQLHFKNQPSLDQIAQKIHVSPAHLQRLFTEWAGTSPKKFLQYISVEYAKKILVQEQATLFDATYATGLSSTSRLHDLFITIEGMSPAAYKNGGKDLLIHYSFATSPFGKLIVASTTKGVCYMVFEDDTVEAEIGLKRKFPHASFQKKQDLLQQQALSIFQYDVNQLPEIKLHLKGTDFQLKVWESLLKIPMGKLCTYGKLARHIGHPQASRAVGTAIGSNPIAYLIPCHRVIQSSGYFGGYRWGATRKAAIVGWEGARVN